MKREAEEADKRAKALEKSEQEDNQRAEKLQQEKAAEESAARDDKRKAEKALQLAKDT